MTDQWQLIVTLAQAAPAAAAENAGLTREGWAVMLISIGTVLSLLSYCLFRVLTLPPVNVQDLKGPLKIDTGDTQDVN